MKHSNRRYETRFANSPDDEKQSARMFVGGFHAADPARISTHSIIYGDHASREIEEDRMFHIVGGYNKLLEALVRSLPERSPFEPGCQ